MMEAALALINGKVYSVNEDDAVQRGEAVVVKDGKILAICNNREAAQYIGRETEVIDCGGNTILPGLCDGHCHPSWAASFFESCNLFDIVGTPEDTSREVAQKYLNRLKEYMQTHKEDKIIRAAGWNRAFFSGGCKDSAWPDRHDIDNICSDRPVIIESYCQHALWVNTKAIEMAGLSAQTEAPSFGQLFREADGFPSGMFFEMESQNLIKDNLPGYDFTIEQYKRTIERYQRELANNFGITLVNDCFHTANAKEAYKELAQEGKLTLRVRGVYLLSDCGDLSQIKSIAQAKGRDNVNDTFEINTIKIFLEGEFTMLEPFEPKIIQEQGLPEGYGGKLFYEDETVMKAMEEAMKTGLQIHIHAMGDRAVKQAVDTLIHGQNKTHTRNRSVIAHLMAVRDEDISRISENNIICNCQPRWMIYDSDAAEYYPAYFGKKRTMNFYPNQRFLDKGSVVSYGTDFPVTPPPNPFHGIQCAVTRSIFPGDKAEYERYKGTILGPDGNQKIDCVSLKDAVKSTSYSGAYQTFLEGVTGSIEVGKSAELAVLTCDLEKVPINEIYKTEVAATIFKGKVVYKR